MQETRLKGLEFGLHDGFVSPNFNSIQLLLKVISFSFKVRCCGKKTTVRLSYLMMCDAALKQRGGENWESGWKYFAWRQGKVMFIWKKDLSRERKSTYPAFWLRPSCFLHCNWRCHHLHSCSYSPHLELLTYSLVLLKVIWILVF